MCVVTLALFRIILELAHFHLGEILRERLLQWVGHYVNMCAVCSSTLGLVRTVLRRRPRTTWFSWTVSGARTSRRRDTPLNDVIPTHTFALFIVTATKNEPIRFLDFCCCLTTALVTTVDMETVARQRTFKTPPPPRPLPVHSHFQCVQVVLRSFSSLPFPNLPRCVRLFTCKLASVATRLEPRYG